MIELHVGRRFTGPDRISYECDCPKQPCGLTLMSEWLPDCPFHGGTKTIRQSHPADACPGIAMGYERRYISATAKAAHLVAPAELSAFNHTPTALCGMWAWSASDWWGTGSQEEAERAASMPVCKTCTRKAAA